MLVYLSVMNHMQYKAQIAYGNTWWYMGHGDMSIYSTAILLTERVVQCNCNLLVNYILKLDLKI